jgi:tetratricopeptide (TPR) repeat protein
MKKIIVVLLPVLLVAAACAPPAAVPPSPVSAQAPSVSAQERARQEIAAHLLAGRHQEALQRIALERRRSGSERLLEKEQFRVLREVSSVGEKFFQAGEYERSGLALRLALDHYPPRSTVAEELGISRQELQDRLDLCAERLMAQGLTEYRAGNLPAAIAAWKQILAFHHSHEGAKNGIQTAEIQLQNLRALPEK